MEAELEVRIRAIKEGKKLIITLERFKEVKPCTIYLSNIIDIQSVEGAKMNLGEGGIELIPIKDSVTTTITVTL